MKEIVDKIMLSARVAVVALAVLALVVSGAGAAARLFTDQNRPAMPAEKPQIATLDQKPDPEETSGEMARGGHPWTEQVACWQATIAWLGGGIQSRAHLSTTTPLLSASWRTVPVWSDQVYTTANLVDHRLGYRFTLVGAKPSGTS